MSSSTAWPAYASAEPTSSWSPPARSRPGCRRCRLQRRPRDLARQQAAASVGQGLLVHRYTEEFARHGQVTGQVLLTLDDVTRRSHYRNAQRTFAKLLELGVVPIVNENDTVATSEIRFGDNDRLAALVAHLVHADLLVLLSDVDGLYDAPPSDPSSPLDLRGERREPARGRRASAAPGRPESAPAACTPSSRRRGSRPAPASRWCSPTWCTRGQRWQGSRSAPCSTRPAVVGRPGCCGSRTPPRPRAGSSSTTAPCARSPSGARRCCPPASPAVAGGFVAGDPVDLVDERGQVVARGLVNYDAERAARAARSVHA